MKKFLSRVFPKLTRYYSIFIKEILFHPNSYLHATGWFKSLKANKPVDKEGLPIPWMNYPMIELLRERLNKQQTLFEYGSGYSTLFYANLVSKVVSLEYDKNWAKHLKSSLPANAEILFKEKDINGEYCRAIQLTNRKFDVVIIDGRDRVNCLKQCIEKLSETGVVIFDDSHRERYKEGLDFAQQNGFKVLHLQGLKPTGYKYYRSTLLYRPSNCFDL